MSEDDKNKTPDGPTEPWTPPPTDGVSAEHHTKKEGENEALDLEAEELARLNDESLNESSEFKTPKLKELLQSSDSPSRFMTVLALSFAVLAAACFILLITMYMKSRHVKKPVPVAEKIVVEPSITFAMGEFKLFIKSESEKAEERELRVDIVAECTTSEACDTIKEKMPEARDLVLPVLSVTTQEEWMKVENKNLIRKKIADRLNSMTLPGKVLQVLFTNMTIERGK